MLVHDTNPLDRFRSLDVDFCRWAVGSTPRLILWPATLANDETETSTPSRLRWPARVGEDAATRLLLLLALSQQTDAQRWSRVLRGRGTTDVDTEKHLYTMQVDSTRLDSTPPSALKKKGGARTKQTKKKAMQNVAAARVCCLQVWLPRGSEDGWTVCTYNASNTSRQANPTRRPAAPTFQSAGHVGPRCSRDISTVTVFSSPVLLWPLSLLNSGIDGARICNSLLWPASSPPPPPPPTSRRRRIITPWPWSLVISRGTGSKIEGVVTGTGLVEENNCWPFDTGVQR